MFFFFIYINYKLNRYGGKYSKNYDKYTISKKKKKIVKINCCCRGRGYEVSYCSTEFSNAQAVWFIQEILSQFSKRKRCVLWVSDFIKLLSNWTDMNNIFGCCCCCFKSHSLQWRSHLFLCTSFCFPLASERPNRGK